MARRLLPAPRDETECQFCLIGACALHGRRNLRSQTENRVQAGFGGAIPGLSASLVWGSWRMPMEESGCGGEVFPAAGVNRAHGLDVRLFSGSNGRWSGAVTGGSGKIVGEAPERSLQAFSGGARPWFRLCWPGHGNAWRNGPGYDSRAACTWRELGCRAKSLNPDYS